MGKYDSVNAALRKFAAHGEDRDRTTRVDEYSTDYYFVAVFQSAAARDEALARLDFQVNRYILGEELMEAIGETLTAKQLSWPKARATLTQEQTDRLAKE